MDWFERNILTFLGTGLSYNFLVINPENWFWFISYWYCILILISQIFIFISFILITIRKTTKKNGVSNDPDVIIKNFRRK